MTFARVRALIFVAVLFITAGVVVIMAIGRDTQTGLVADNPCANGLVPANITMPEREEVTLNVFNATSRVSLAEQIGGEFKTRGFKLDKTGGAPKVKNFNEKYDREIEYGDEIAIIVYGPEAVGAAWLVSAYFLVGEATRIFDIKREGAEVDVIIGGRFQQLATTTEVNQSIAAVGKPELEVGTCEAPVKRSPAP